MASDLRELIKTWRDYAKRCFDKGAVSCGNVAECCADELERALAAQPAPIALREKLRSCEEALAAAERRATELEAPQPATAPEGWRKALEDLLDHVDAATCLHENIHRGGAIWTICDDCGRKWADDEGGFVPHEDAQAVAAARAMLAAAPSPAVVNHELTTAQGDGCGACGDGCSGGPCRLAQESPQPEAQAGADDEESDDAH